MSIRGFEALLSRISGKTAQPKTAAVSATAVAKLSCRLSGGRWGQLLFGADYVPIGCQPIAIPG